MEECMQDKRMNDRATRAVKIDAAGWGLFSLWMGTAMLAHFSAGTTLLGTGIIIIGTQVMVKYAEQKLNAFGIAAGLLITAAGACNLLAIKVDLLPILCLAAGASFMISYFGGIRTNKS
jgi:hypothetical protein